MLLYTLLSKEFSCRGISNKRDLRLEQNMAENMLNAASPTINEPQPTMK